MKIVGYSDPLSVAPGQTIRFKVSCEHQSYHAEIVRLIHGDENPRGPGFKQAEIPTDASGDYPGRVQHIHPGSYILVPDSPALRLRRSFTLQAWIFPTTPRKGSQGLMTKCAPSGESGYGLFIGQDGGLELRIGGGSGAGERVASGQALRAFQWYFVAAAFDGDAGTVRLYQEPLSPWPMDETLATVSKRVAIKDVGQSDVGFLMAAHWGGAGAGATRTDGHFNGKIDSPRVFGRALTGAEIGSLKQGSDPRSLGEALVAAWDFSSDIGTSHARDISGNERHGRVVNVPCRGVTGRNWTGRETDFRRAPEEYGAIHFHDDDLEDAGWDTDFEFNVPRPFKSGIYAAQLTAGGDEDHVPFFVRPPRGGTGATILFLAPTNSYLAYGNEHMEDIPIEIAPLQNMENCRAQYEYLRRERLSSMYDYHPDGTGHAYASRLRPIVNMRPKFRMRVTDCPFQFPADLHLLDWLEQKGHAFDVATDEDLHFEGKDLLSPYRVVITGNHPEYFSGPMLDAVAGYLEGGGRLMYMGGNGFYWVTTFDPERPHIIELRRWHGTGNWTASPGEYHHSTTGEIGGLWRFRGRAPQKLVGIGFTAQGVDRGAPYRRQPESLNPRAAFIFQGIKDDELIGDCESLTLNYGAAGLELDRLDYALGSPPHTLLLASSFGHSDSYQHVVEEVLLNDGKQGGTVNPLVRADMAYFETPNGGAVFSTGSITWCGSLSHNNYQNNVSRITENVLSRFLSADPLS